MRRLRDPERIVSENVDSRFTVEVTVVVCNSCGAARATDFHYLMPADADYLRAIDRD